MTLSCCNLESEFEQLWLYRKVQLWNVPYCALTLHILYEIYPPLISTRASRFPFCFCKDLHFFALISSKKDGIYYSFSWIFVKYYHLTRRWDDICTSKPSRLSHTVSPSVRTRNKSFFGRGPTCPRRFLFTLRFPKGKQEVLTLPPLNLVVCKDKCRRLSLSVRGCGNDSFQRDILLFLMKLNGQSGRKETCKPFLLFSLLEIHPCVPSLVTLLMNFDEWGTFETAKR